MTRIIAASALAALLSSTAIAQTEAPAGAQPPVPPAVDQTAPSAEAPLMPSLDEPEMEAGEEEDEADMMDAETMRPGPMMGGDMMGGGMMREHMRGGQAGAQGPSGDYPMGHGRHYWRGHHGAARGGGPRGAVFRFSLGEGGPSFTIRCAVRDSTRECAEAVLPMLDRVLPQRVGQ